MATIPFAQNTEMVRSFIDPTKKVRVYRNLHKGCYSVQQNGRVKCHVDCITLEDANLIVHEKGRDKVRKERVKNVHAFIDGYLPENVQDSVNQYERHFWHEIYYNPYKTDRWINKETSEQIRYATIVTCAPCKRVYGVTRWFKN